MVCQFEFCILNSLHVVTKSYYNLIKRVSGSGIYFIASASVAYFLITTPVLFKVLVNIIAHILRKSTNVYIKSLFNFLLHPLSLEYIVSPQFSVLLINLVKRGTLSIHTYMRKDQMTPGSIISFFFCVKP